MPFKVTNLNSVSELPAIDSNFSLEVSEGLSKTQKRLPSWLIFDDRGSELFKKITDLEDYYPAVCELEIFRKNKDFISSFLPEEPINFVELGSGDGRKTIVLLKHFLNTQG